jgi:hypothetical protein
MPSGTREPPIWRGRTAEAELVQAVRIDRYGALAAGSATSVAGF